MQRAARRYVAGSTAEDALRAAAGRPATIGYWNSGDEPPATVARELEASLAAVAGHDAYVSAKATEIGFDAGLLRGLGTPVHLDAMSIDTVDRTWALAEQVQVHGVTLPGRWRRSPDDVERIAPLGVRVRVVKGQFPAADDVDPARGFLAVLDRLVDAGVERIAIATHDRRLAATALARAPHAELEQLYGLRPVEHPGARVYVPYGTAYLPYAIRRLRQDPRIAWWLARDLVRP